MAFKIFQIWACGDFVGVNRTSKGKVYTFKRKSPYELWCYPFLKKLRNDLVHDRVVYQNVHFAQSRVEIKSIRYQSRMENLKMEA